ncbi:RNA polymerase sigma factor [Streptomyces sp. NPDC001700]
MMPGAIKERTTEQVTALYAARLECGWELSDLADRLRLEAAERDVKLPVHNHPLFTRIKLWERGEGVPRARYVELLTAVYGKTATELGLPDRSQPPIDAERWGRLYERYFDWTVSYLWRRVHQRDLAMDLAQDTFIEIGRTLHKIDPAKEGNLYGFVAQQARWTLGLYRQSSRSWRETAADFGAEEKPASDAHSSPEGTIALTIDLNRVLAALPARDRQVIALRIFDDLTVEQIAGVISLSHTRTQKLMNRAVDTLRTRLTGQPITWTIPGSVRDLEKAA